MASHFKKVEESSPDPMGDSQQDASRDRGVRPEGDGLSNEALDDATPPEVVPEGAPEEGADGRTTTGRDEVAPAPEAGESGSKPDGDEPDSTGTRTSSDGQGGTGRLAVLAREVGGRLHKPLGALGQRAAALARDALPTVKRGLLVLVAILVPLYLAGIVLFGARFVPGTMVGGVDASWLTVDELANRVDEAAESYVGTVEGGGLSFSVSADDIDLRVDGQAFALDALARQSAPAWPVTLLSGARIDPVATATIDEQRLAELLSGIVLGHNLTATEPVDAYVAYDVDKGSFEVVDGQRGDRINLDATIARVAADAALLRPKIALGEEELALPRYTLDCEALYEARDRANEILGTTLHLTNEGEDAFVVSKSHSNPWIDFLYEDDLKKLESLVAKQQEEAAWDDDATEEDGEVEGYYRYDKELGDFVWARYVESEEGEEVAYEPWEQLDTDMGTIFVGEDGNRVGVRVSRPGIRSWAFLTLNALFDGETEERTWGIDAWETAGRMKESLDACRSGNVAIATQVLSERPPETEGHEQRGRHIDVNLTTQYARMYDTDGTTVLWRSYIVSGQAGDLDTPTGEFEIWERERDLVMIGPDYDGDGKPDYETPCSYWLGFFEGCGIHDSDWRTYYGKDIYTWYGSHGCVNVSKEKVAELWNLTVLGDKVFIHY